MRPAGWTVLALVNTKLLNQKIKISGNAAHPARIAGVLRTPALVAYGWGATSFKLKSSFKDKTDQDENALHQARKTPYVSIFCDISRI